MEKAKKVEHQNPYNDYNHSSEARKKEALKEARTEAFAEAWAEAWVEKRQAVRQKIAAPSEVQIHEQKSAPAPLKSRNSGRPEENLEAKNPEDLLLSTFQGRVVLKDDADAHLLSEMMKDVVQGIQRGE